MQWSPATARQLASELVDLASDRWRHVELVAQTVGELANGMPAWNRLVSGAWLHDIGYAPELVMTGMHAIDGAMYLGRSGAPSALVSLVAYHTGAEYEADERALLDKLGQFDRPPQEDLDLLILADLVSGSTGKPVSVAERLDDIEQRYEPQHPVHRAILRSRPYLETAVGRAAARVGYPM